MAVTNNTEIRGTRKAEIFGILAGWTMRCWAATLRHEFDDRCGIMSFRSHPHPVIFAMWHNRIFTVPPVWRISGGMGRRTSVLTSASKDGSILAAAMAVFGIGSIRGSSSRRAVAALIGMKRALASGVDICITPDGPRGPRYGFQPGVIKLAQSSGAPIVPIHVSYSSAWRLRTWDGLVIAKPFSKVTIIFDTMLVVPAKLDEIQFQHEVARVHAALIAGADDA
jgi:lysophospholipid acyltransferase (LPLAT)-like uncharacterized protein